MGSAPPANAPPGIPATGPSSKPASTSKSASTKTEGESPHESFATLLESATQGADEQGGGETAALPAGSTPPTPEAPPDVTDLLAQLVALAQGLTDGGSTGPTESTESNLLLDRLAEAGGLETRADGTGALDALDVLGAVEALMAYLVMGQQTPIDPDATTALPDDLVALLQQIEGTPSGAATDLELAARQAVQAAVELTSAEPVVAANAADAGGAPDLNPSEAALAATSASVAVETGEPDEGTAEQGVLVAPAIEPSDDGARIARTAVAQPSTVERTSEVATAVTPVESAAEVERGESDIPSADASATPVATHPGGARGTEAAGGMTVQAPVETPVETVNATRVVNAATLPAEVADTVRTAVFHGDSEVRLVLNPPDLGHLDIRITRGEHGLRIVMEASQAGARDLIDRSITGLHQALEARDLRVDRLEVRATDTGRGSLDTSAGGQQSGRGASDGSQGDGAPEWSPVAMFEAMNNETAGAGQSEQPTDRDASGVAGSVDVLA